MYIKEPTGPGLDLNSQRWIAERLGIDLSSTSLPDAAASLYSMMSQMLSGSIQVDDTQLDYPALGREMFAAGVGLDLIDAEMLELGEEARIASMVDNLVQIFLVDASLSRFRPNRN